MLTRPLLVLLPISQDITDPGAIGQLIHLLKVFLGNLERFGGHVGNVLPDQLARIDAGPVDFLQQEAAEGLDAGPEERAVERNIDAFERYGGEPALQINRLGFGFGLFGALLDNFHQVSLDIFKGHGLRQRLNVNFLRFQVIQNIGEAVESTKLS